MCLLIDGTWTDEDQKILALAGWDYSFYIDQTDELKKVIV